MVDRKISDLPPASDLDGAVIAIVQDGQNRQAPIELFQVVVDQAVPVAPPAFVDLKALGTLNKTVPGNVRTGLSSTLMTGGGYAAELQIAVTGTAGSAVLSSPDASKLAGLGSAGFDAALNSTDGLQDFIATVLSTDGSTTITLSRPLAANFSGVLMSKWDIANGQHLTSGATRAFARHVATVGHEVTAKGRCAAGTWIDLNANYNRVWAKNAALTSYGVSNSASPVVQSSMISAPGLNIAGPDNFGSTSMSTANRGMQVGTHTSGHGAIATLEGGGEDQVLDFWVAAWRITTTLTGVAITVVVKNNGTTVYSDTQDHIVRKHEVVIRQAGTVTVEVTNTDGAIYYLDLSNMTMREVGAPGPLIWPGEKGVFLGDSWGAFYNGLFASVLATLTSSTIVNHSVGGTTTVWGLAWFEQYVIDEDPDVLFLEFFTNDLNNTSVPTFVGPDGVTYPLWPSGLSAAQAQELWRQNIDKLIRLCRDNGIRPVVLMPAGSATNSQTQVQANASWALDRPLPLDWSALATEIADDAAFCNRFGKRAGSEVFDVTNSRVMVAQGSGPVSPWKDKATGLVTVTPA